VKIKILEIRQHKKKHWWSFDVKTHDVKVLIDGIVTKTVSLFLPDSTSETSLHSYIKWALITGDQFADIRAKDVKLTAPKELRPFISSEFEV